MSWLLLAIAALALAALEYFWAEYAWQSLGFRGGCDEILAEPGETVTWSGTVENTGKWPIPFVRVTERFPAEARIQESEDWIRNHCIRNMLQWYKEEKMSLLPRQSRSRTVRLSFPARGVYRIGSYQVSAGDLLGFREKGISGDWQEMVIMPERSSNTVSLDALGGFLGDVSVRRFILEDPILTVGFREYTGREPMKAISWTRTATAGSLQVRQYDYTAERHIMILLNVEGASPEELEESFRLMRSVCEALEQTKIPYGMRTNGNLTAVSGKIRWMPEGLGLRHLNTILYGLGRADATCLHSFRYLTEQTLRHRKSNEAYIVITPPLTNTSRSCVKALESQVGSGVCVLIAEGEGEKA
jgi:uncharacterized protein (DUF58 family)